MWFVPEKWHGLILIPKPSRVLLKFNKVKKSSVIVNGKDNTKQYIYDNIK